MHVVTPATTRLLIRPIERVDDLSDAYLHLILGVTGAGIDHYSATKLAGAALELMRNAIVHGGGQLSVNLTARDAAPALEVVVTDRGPGIAGATRTLLPEQYGDGLRAAADVFDSLHVCNRPGAGAQAVGTFKLSAEAIAGVRAEPVQPAAEPIAPETGPARDDQDLAGAQPGQTIEALQAQVRELTEKCAQLTRAKNEAESVARARSSFLATMSHEIRTPLNAIVGVSGVLLSELMLEGQRDHFELIRNSSEHLLSVINNILDFSKIEAGKVQLECAPFLLRQCIEDAFDVAIQRSAGKRIKCAYWLPNDVPERFKGDMTRLRQVLVNLLSNAAKFTDDGGEISIAVTAEPREDDVWAVEIAVSDSGIGIAADRLHTLFTAFEQTDNSVYRRFGGTGLGLAITMGLVEAMGGRVNVDSAPGAGSTFRVTLQLASAGAEPLTDTAAALRAAMRGKRAELHVASTAVKRNIENHLRAFGIDIAPVRDDDPRVPDVVIAERSRCDRVAQRYGARPDGERPPLIVVSDAGRDADSGDLYLTPAGSLPMPVKRNALFSLLVTSLGVIDPAHDRRRRDRPADHEIASKYPLKVLLVEDNSVNQRVATLMLQRLGYQPGIASDGVEAVRQVEMMDYDVILMDMRMPNLNGLEATRQIRNLPTARNKPVVLATTADISDETRADCMEAGCDGMLLKPVRLSDLVLALIRAHTALHPPQDRKRSAPPREAAIRNR